VVAVELGTAVSVGAAGAGVAATGEGGGGVGGGLESAGRSETMTHAGVVIETSSTQATFKQLFIIR
jgi:hypothetical protein